VEHDCLPAGGHVMEVNGLWYRNIRVPHSASTSYFRLSICSVCSFVRVRIQLSVDVLSY
jgi:hypothetical protein